MVNIIQMLLSFAGILFPDRSLMRDKYATLINNSKDYKIDNSINIDHFMKTVINLYNAFPDKNLYERDEYLNLFNNNELNLSFDRTPELAVHVRMIADIIPEPTVIFGPDENVNFANEACTRSGFMPETTMAQFIATTADFGPFRKAMQDLAAGETVAYVDTNARTAHKRMPILVRRLSQHNNSAFVIASLAKSSFKPEILELFRCAYDLTESEVAIAALISHGKNPAQIAFDRDVSVLTVRTQIKSIKQKTGVQDLPNLVQLFLRFYFTATGLLGMSTTEKQQRLEIGKTKKHNIRAKDGRHLCVFELGNPSGRPVLLLHGLPHGAILPQSSNSLLSEHNIRIIIPLRPGFGDSDPFPDTNIGARIDQVVDDINDICTYLNLRDPMAVISLPGGSAFALRLSYRHPEIVERLVMLGRPPIWKAQYFDQMPTQHKFHLAIPNFPTPLPERFIQTFIFNLTGQIGTDFLRNTARGSQADAPELENLEVIETIISAYEYCCKQSVRSFISELPLLTFDMTAEAVRVLQPIRVLYGGQDRTVSQNIIDSFTECVPAASSKCLPNVGEYALYTQLQTILTEFST